MKGPLRIFYAADAILFVPNIYIAFECIDLAGHMRGMVSCVRIDDQTQSSHASEATLIIKNAVKFLMSSLCIV